MNTKTALVGVAAATFAAVIIGLQCAYGAVTNWTVTAGQYLMADQDGNIVPPGYAVGLEDIAASEAAAAATAAAAQAVADSTAAASNAVDEIVSVLTGAIGFGYVQGYTVSLSGTVEVSTNASASIVYCQFGQAGTTNISGTAYTGHFIWHAYNETMNSMPAIKYKVGLEATNDWEFCEYQQTAQYDNHTLNGVTYETVYRSTVWLPASLDSAFFLAFCEIAGGGSAGGFFDVQGGFTIGGKAGYTGAVNRDGYIWHYEFGALMGVEVAP